MVFDPSTKNREKSNITESPLGRPLVDRDVVPAAARATLLKPAYDKTITKAIFGDYLLSTRTPPHTRPRFVELTAFILNGGCARERTPDIVVDDVVSRLIKSKFKYLWIIKHS